MVVASKIMSTGIIVFSITAGFIFFYIMSDLPKEEKKKHMEELTLQLIHFIIFIWLGKIIVNFSIFTKDPLAVVAHPSNREAFYLAVLFSIIVLIYKSVRLKIDVLPLVESFLHVFLVGSFIYEFIQLIWNDSSYTFGYLVLLAALFVLFFMIHGYMSSSMLTITMLTGWSLGIILLSFIQPFVAVFGYIMAPWFIGLFFITSLSFFIFNQRKRD